ncbi:unnamed protein product, partial [Meganyctiphanes norvegica]
HGDFEWSCYWSDDGPKICTLENGTEVAGSDSDDNEFCEIDTKCTAFGGSCYTGVTDCPKGQGIIEDGCGKDGCVCCSPSSCSGDECFYNGSCIDHDTGFGDKCNHYYCAVGQLNHMYRDNEWWDDCYLYYCINGTEYSQRDPACCEYKGEFHANGRYIISDCGILFCLDSVVVATEYVNRECVSSRCMVANDPHISGFGEPGYYDWHERCNFSLAQPGYGYDPSFALYSQFTVCPSIYSSAASCVGDTVYHDNSNVLFADLKNLSRIYVNNVPYTLSTFLKPLIIGGEETTVFRISDTKVRVLGASGLLVEFDVNWVNVWAMPTAVDSLHGLCNPFISRDGAVVPTVTEFAQSWK